MLEDVRIRLTRDELDIDRLALSWNAGAALLGTLAFDPVDAGAVAYRRLPALEAAAGRSAVLELPFEVRLDDATRGEPDPDGRRRYSVVWRDQGRRELRRAAFDDSQRRDRGEQRLS